MRQLHQLLCLASLGALGACGNTATSPSLAATCGADVLSEAPSGCGLVVNEVAAAGEPDDWFEVINVGAETIDLSDFLFVDRSGALDRARAFPAFQLAPGQRHVQYVSGHVTGFRLGSDEALWLYRADDAMPVDHVDWAEGASPVGGSYARVPDASGAFTTRERDTLGGPNT